MKAAATFYTNLTDVLKSRLALATAAFAEARARKDLPFDSPTATPFRGVVGWLYPVQTDQPARFALRPGVQYLTAGRTPGIHLDANPQAVATIEVLRDRVEIVKKGESPENAQVVYHGERVMIGAQSYRLAQLPARATAQALRNLFPALLLGLVMMARADAFAAPAPAEPKAAPVTTSSYREVGARFREPFVVRETLTGITRISPANVTAQVTVGTDNHPITVTDARPVRTHYLVLYDGSVLCSARKMEGPLAQEIRTLLEHLDPEGRVTLVRYDRRPGTKGDSRINYERMLAAASPIGSVRFNTRLVRCSADTTSVPGLSAVVDVAANNFDGKTDDDNGRAPRRVVVLFSPGNVGALGDSEVAALKKLGVEYVHTVVFSPVTSEIVRQALEALGDFGITTWWSKPKPLQLYSKLNYAWDFDLQATLPPNVREGTYALNIDVNANGRSLSIGVPLRYSMDPHNLLMYRIWVGVLATLATALAGFVTYRVVRYYRTKRCPHDGMIMSRAWNHCLFCARGRHPMLLVERGDKNLERAFVLKDPVVHVGRRIGDALRLRLVPKGQGLRVTRVLSDTYEVALARGPAYRLNGEGRVDPVYLKHGDRIDLGAYQIHFLRHPGTETNT